MGCSWTVGEYAGICHHLVLELVIGHDPIDDVPPLEGLGIVLRAAEYHLFCPRRPCAGSDALDAAKQCTRGDHRLSLTETGRFAGPYQIAGENELHSRCDAQPLHCSDGWERKSFELSNHGEIDFEHLATLDPRDVTKNADVRATRENGAFGTNSTADFQSASNPLSQRFSGGL